MSAPVPAHAARPVEELRVERARQWTTRCCRCFPNAVTKAGYCQCCDYNHATGERSTFIDPDYFGDER